MLLNDIKKHADQLVFLIETTLDNTIRKPRALDDCLSGFVPYCGWDHSIKYQTNAHVKISSAEVHDMATAIVVESGFSVVSTYPAPHGSAMMAQSFGHIRIANVVSIDEFMLRKFVGKNVTVKVGGLVYKGKPNEQLLTGDEYATYFVGKFVSYDFDDQVLDITVGMDSGELSHLFPLREFGPGKLEGQTIPFCCGSPKGFRFPVVRDGVGVFHDGLVDTSDVIRDDVQVGYVGHGINFYPKLYLRFGGFKDESGYTVYTRSDHTFTNDGDTTVDLSGVMTGSISVVGDGATVVASGDSFRIVQGDAESKQTLTSADFNWVEVDTTNVVTSGGYQAAASLSGALEVEAVGGRWFKIYDTSGDSTGGRVTIDLGDVVGELQLVVRQTDLLGISFPVEPSSLVQEDGTPENWVATFNSLNSDTVEFDFESAGTGDKVAVWVKQMELFKANPVEVTISFDTAIAGLGLGVDAGAGSMGFTGFSAAPSLVLSAGEVSDVMQFSLNNTVQIKFTYLSGYGSSSFYFDEIKVEAVGWGAQRDGDEIVIRPVPDSLRSTSGLPADFAAFSIKGDYGNPVAFGDNYVLKFEARVESDNLSEVEAFAYAGDLESVLVGSEYAEYTLEGVQDSEFGSLFGVACARGDVAFKGGLLDTTVPDVDYQIRIRYMSVYPKAIDQSSLSFYDNKSGVRARLKTYRVSNASLFDNLPTNLALYDDRGNVVFNKDYSDISGDVIGWKADAKSVESFRKISALASGEDQITCDFDGELTDFVLQDRRPWIEHVAAESAGLGYVIKENEAVSGATLTRRPVSTDLALDFALTEGEMIPGTIAPSSGEPREHRFIVEYAVDHSDAARTRSIKSRFGFSGESGVRTIVTSLREYEDAVARGESIVLESMYNDVVPVGLVGVGLGLECGMYGTAQHPRIADGRRCVIIEVDETESRETYLLLHVFRA